MNIIKHTLLLALAFLISVGAWAQTPQKYASGTVDISALRANDTLMEGVTITTSKTTTFVFAPNSYAIYGSQYNTDQQFTRSQPVLIGTDGTFPGSQYDVTPYNTEQYTNGNAWVVDSVKSDGIVYYCYLAGVTSTLPITEVPRLLDDGSWIFAMPAGNRLVGVEYKSAGALAWSPAVVGGVNGYLGQESAVSFPALSNSNSLDGVRFGSSNTSVATINSSTGEITFVAAGSATIYAVFNGNDDFLYDSVYYTLNVLPLPILTLSTVGNGTVELAGITMSQETQEEFTTNLIQDSYTSENVTITCTASGDKDGFFLGGGGRKATISVPHGIITRAIFITGYYANNSDGFVSPKGYVSNDYESEQHTKDPVNIEVSDINVSSLTVSSSKTLQIKKVIVYYVRLILPDGVSFGTADNTYNVIPGTRVVIEATPADYNHLDSWSNGAAINFTLTDTVTVNSDTTITATFEQNAPQLAWTYRGSTDLPMGGVSAYIGFAYDTLNLINWTANNEFRDLYQSNHSAIRFGSTDDGVITYGPSGWEAVAPGSCRIYAVHDGSTMAYDSVVLDVDILPVDTLTLAANNSQWGSVDVVRPLDSVAFTETPGQYLVIPYTRVVVKAEAPYSNFASWSDGAAINETLTDTIVVSGNISLTANFSQINPELAWTYDEEDMPAEGISAYMGFSDDTVARVSFTTSEVFRALMDNDASAARFGSTDESVARYGANGLEIVGPGVCDIYMVHDGSVMLYDSVAFKVTILHSNVLTLAANDNNSVEIDGTIISPIFSETMNTNTRSNTYTGRHFTVSCVDAGSDAGFFVNTWKNATISARNNGTISHVELTVGYYEEFAGALVSTEGIVQAENGNTSITITDVNAPSLSIQTSSDFVQIRNVTVYYSEPLLPEGIARSSSVDNVYYVLPSIDTVVVKAVPAEHYHFTAWSNGAAVNETLTDTIAIISDTTITATFEKNPVNLAWTYEEEDMPAEGLRAYYGFADDTLALVEWASNDEFRTLYQNDPSVLRIGSTDNSVVTYGANGFEVVGVGECDIYMVHDGSVMAYDSVAFHVNILQPLTLTLASNDALAGTVTPEGLGGVVTWNSETWADLSTENATSLTSDGITFTKTGGDSDMRKSNSGNLSFFVSKYADDETLVISTTGAPFTRIEMTMTNVAGQYNPDINPTDGWTWEGTLAVWEGAPTTSLTLSSCTTTVSQIVFHRASTPGIAASATEGQYLIIPGTKVIAKATPTEHHHLASWSNGAAVNETLTDTITVSSDTTLTATFEKNDPELAWTYDEEEDMPAQGISAYYGFTADTMALINWRANSEFYTLYQNNHAVLRLGSTDNSVVAMGANGFEVVGVGECDIYMVHDGSVMAYDSVAFHVTILQPLTLTLASNDALAGTVTPEGQGSVVTWNSDTWADLSTDNATTFTSGDITFATTGNAVMFNSEGDLRLYVRGSDNSKTLTISTTGAPFTRIEMTLLDPVDEYNPDIKPVDGWTGAGNLAVWEGEPTQSLTLTSCTTWVTQMAFYRSGNPGLAATATEDQYLVIPGTTVVVKATPTEHHHLASWSNGAAVNETLTDTITVSSDTTLTATFEKNDPELVWTYDEEDMPAQGIRAYYGFTADTMALIGWYSNEEFYNLYMNTHSVIRFGSTDNSVVTYGANGFEAVGVGECYIYMVHDGSVMAYDSVAVHVTILPSHVLTLAATGEGNVEIDGTIISPISSETMNTNTRSNTYTGKHFTVSCVDVGDNDGFFVNTWKNATISARNGGTISRVELTVGYYEDYAGALVSTEGSVDAENGNTSITITDVNAPSLSIQTSSDYVLIRNVTVYYSEPILPEGIIYGSVDNTYYVLPGTDNVVVKAVPAEHYHLASWSNGAAVNETLTDTIAVVSDTTITATFEKTSPELVWTYDEEDMPAQGVSAYYGFTDDIMALINWRANSEFYTLYQNNHAVLRLGSTDNSVVTMGANGFEVVGVGECDIYMVHDGSVMAFDSVAFHVTILQPLTLTLASNDALMGTVTPEGLGGVVTWNSETWADLSTENATSFTSDGITFTTTGNSNMRNYDGNLFFFVSKYADDRTLVISTTGAPFTRIEMTMTDVAGQYNPDIIPTDGWTWEGTLAVWEGAPTTSLTLSSCTTTVSQIVFHRAVSSSVLTTATEGVYKVVPGTKVVVKASPAEHSHLVSWSNGAAVNETLTDTITVSSDTTITAIFEKNAPELVWTYDEEDMPAQGVSAYYGFTADTIALINWRANSEFYTLYENNNDVLRLGSTDNSVVAMGANGFEVVGVGECDIYMVHDGSVMAYDSVAFHVTILQPYTLTLNANETAMGSVELVRIDRPATVHSGAIEVSSLHVGDILQDIASISGNGYFSLAQNRFKQNGTLSDFGSALSIYQIASVSGTTITTTWDAVCTPVDENGNDANAWVVLEITANGPTVGGYNVSGETPMISVTPDGVLALTDNTYSVVPGTEVSVVATANERYHMASWSNGDEVSDLLIDTATLTVSEDMTLTANFAQNPLLTLATVGNGTVVAELGGAVTWNTQTWADMSTESVPSFTVGDITISTTGYMGKWHEYITTLVDQYEDAETLTISTTGAPFTRIELLLVDPVDEYNPNIQPIDGWTFEGTLAVWEGEPTQSLTLTSCTTDVSQIVFHRAASSSVLTTATEGVYNVVPGTKVVVKASPAEHSHLVSWSNGAAVNEMLTDTIAVVFDTTVTATFEHNAPELAWTYRGSAMPAEGVSAYYGFTDDTTALIDFTANEEFIAVLRNNPHTLNMGSTDTNVVKIGAQGIEVRSVGECDIYMVHDGSVMAYDSVAFHVTVLAPSTLTLKVNDDAMGTVALLGGSTQESRDAWCNDTWTGWTDQQNSHTVGDITIAGSTFYESTLAGEPLRILALDGASSSNVTFTSEGAPFTRIEMVMITTSNPWILPMDGWTIDGMKAIWEGNAQSLTLTSCTTYVDSLIFFRASAGSDSILATEQENVYSVVPGAQVMAFATANDRYHMVSWSNDDEVADLLIDTATLTVSEDMTLTANFEANPVLTLKVNDTNMGAVELVGMGSNAAIHSGSIDISTLQEGDILKNVEAFTGTGYITLTVNRHKENGIIQESSSLSIDDIASVDDVTIVTAWSSRHTPVDEASLDANAWVVLGFTADGPILGGYNLTESVYVSNGRATVIANEDSTYSVLPGTEVSVVATANDHYHMASWSNDDEVADLLIDTNTITVSEDMTLTANFVANPVLTLKVNDTNMGAVELVEGTSTTSNIMVEFVTGFDETTEERIVEWLPVLRGIEFPYNTTLRTISDSIDAFMAAIYQSGNDITANNSWNPTMVHQGPFDFSSTPTASGDNIVLGTMIGEPNTNDNDIPITINGDGTFSINADLYNNINELEFNDVHLGPYNVVTPVTGLPEGVLALTDSTYSVLPGTELSVVATANDRYHMVSWSNNDVVTGLLSDTATLTVGEDMTLTANFEANPVLTLKVNDTNMGAVELVGMGSNATIHSGSIDISTLQEGDILKNVEAFTGTGYITLTVNRHKENGIIQESSSLNTDDIASVDDVTIVTAWSSRHTPVDEASLDANAWVVLGFTADGPILGGYNLTESVYVSNGRATVIANEDSTYSVLPGTELRVTANANDGNHIVSWSNNDAVASLLTDTNTITVSEDMTLTANFAQNPTLTLANMGDGSVTVDGITPGTTHNTTVTYNSVMDGATTINKGGVTCSGRFDQYVNMNAPTFTTANGVFTQIIINAAYISPQSNEWEGSETQRTWTGRAQEVSLPGMIYGWEHEVSITFNIETQGEDIYPEGVTATETEGQYLVLPGTELKVIATPADVNYIQAWSTGDEVSNLLSDTIAYTMPDTATTITATFVPYPVLTLTPNNGEWGTMTIGGAAGGSGEETLLTTLNSNVGNGQTVDNLVTVSYAGNVQYEGGWWTAYGQDNQGTMTLQAASEDYTITRCVLYFDYSNSYTLTSLPATLTFMCDGGGRLVLLNGSEIGNEKVTQIQVYGYSNSSIPDGVVANEDGTYSVLPGTELRVIATPDSAHYFVNWDDEAALNSNIAVDSTFTIGFDDDSLAATFAPKPTLTIAQNEAEWGSVMLNGVVINTEVIETPEGIVALTDSIYMVDYGTTVTVSAQATELHHVAGWQDEDSTAMGEATYDEYFVPEPANLFPAVSSLTFTVTADTTAMAVFGINSYDVVATASIDNRQEIGTGLPMGTVSASYIAQDGTPDQTVAPDDTITYTAQGGSPSLLTATAEYGYKFSGWQLEGDEGELITTDTLTLTEAANVMAVFVPDTFTVVLTAIDDTMGQVIISSDASGVLPEGVVSREDGTYGVAYLMNVTVQAIPANRCFDFTEWSNAVEVNDAHNQVVAIDRDSSLTATFVRHMYTGDTTASECDTFVWHGETYTLTPTTAPTYLYTTPDHCDSTVTLHLTVRHSNTGVETATACDQYEWLGTVYTESNTTDQRTLTNIDDCDSVVTLNLTVNYHHDTTVYWQTSGDFTWGRGTSYEEVFSENGTYPRTITTYQGCDSNITIVLAYLPHTTPLPVIYNLMDVAVMIDHLEGDTGRIDYIYYRWYKNGTVVSEGTDADSYSEDGALLSGCYHLEISTDVDHKYWAKSNEICVGTTGIDEVANISLTVAPNPVMRGAHVTVMISGADNLQGATLTVFDAQGRKAIEQNDATGFEAPQTAGIYTVRLVLTDGRMATRKIVVR